MCQSNRFRFKNDDYEATIISAERGPSKSGISTVVKIGFEIEIGFKKPKRTYRSFIVEGPYSPPDAVEADKKELDALFILLTPWNYKKEEDLLIGKRVRFFLETKYNEDEEPFNFPTDFRESRRKDPLPKSADRVSSSTVARSPTRYLTARTP